VPLDVTEDDAAEDLVDSGLPVLGTQRPVALGEEAGFRAFAGRLPAGRTTVASRASSTI